MAKKTKDKHATYNTAEFDRSQKGVTTRRQLGKQEAVNMYTMGTTFIRKIRDVWQIAKTM